MNRKLIKKIWLQIYEGDLKGALYTIKRRKYLSLDNRQYRVSLYGKKYNGFSVYEDAIKRKQGAVIYSFGIGEDLSFSEELMSKFSPQIYAYDPTPRAIDYVKHHPLSQKDFFHFYPYGLSDKDEMATFYLPADDSYDCSGSAISCNHLKKEGINVEMRCLPTLIKENGHTHIDLLKMDIEGSEFKVIERLRDCNVTIDQVCLELHDRFFDDGLKKLEKCLSTMRGMGFILISISYSEQELTFLNEHIS